MAALHIPNTMVPRLAILPRRRAVIRALAFGTTWGVGLGAWLVGIGAWHDGGVCVTDAAFIIALSVAGGVPTIGLFAALAWPFGKNAAAAPVNSAAIDAAGHI